MNLNEFLESLDTELLERNVEITKPTAMDKWGLRIETPKGNQSFQQLEPEWQAAVKEVIGWIRKNLNYADFQQDLKPVDLQFKGDGTVIISSDKGTIDYQGKKLPAIKYRLSGTVAGKIKQSMGA